MAKKILDRTQDYDHGHGTGRSCFDYLRFALYLRIPYIAS